MLNMFFFYFSGFLSLLTMHFASLFLYLTLSHSLSSASCTLSLFVSLYLILSYLYHTWFFLILSLSYFICLTCTLAPTSFPLFPLFCIFLSHASLLIVCHFLCKRCIFICPPPHICLLMSLFVYLSASISVSPFFSIPFSLSLTEVFSAKL